MSLASTLRPDVERIILASTEGIGIVELAVMLKANRATVQKVVRQLVLDGCPIGKTFEVGPLSRWCPADSVAAVRERQLEAQAERREIWLQRGRDNRRRRKTGSDAPCVRLGLKGEVMRQRIVPADQAEPVQTTAPRSVFEWVK